MSANLDDNLMKLIILSTFAFFTLIATPTFADDITIKKCGGPTCEEKRIDYGAAEISCKDINGDILSHWVCEYELGYSCKNTMTGQILKGGFIPTAGELCKHLCGNCPEGWK